MITLKLEAGKRYWTIGGWITPPLIFDNNNPTADCPFYVGNETASSDGDAGNCCWGEDGSGLDSNGMRLIAEYHEPAPAGWILCKDRVPTEADADDRGYVLAYDSDEGSVTTRWNAFGFDPVGEDPYLGFLPIPKFTPPPPEKKKVPLGPDDVPPGSEFRRPLWGKGVSASRIMACGDGVCMMQPPEKYHPSFLTYEELKDSDMEISRDGGKTWERCYKEVDT